MRMLSMLEDSFWLGESHFLGEIRAIHLLSRAIHLGPVVQSIVSLTRLLVVKMLTVLVSSKNISIYVIFNDQSFIDMLTKDIVSFEQLGPVVEVLCPSILPVLAQKHFTYCHI